MAIVEKPVVPGQQEFRRIAASLKDGEPDTIPVLTLAREDDTMDINGLLKLVGTTIGADDLTVENVEERLKSYVDSQPDPKQLEKLRGQVTELQAKLDAKPDKPKVGEHIEGDMRTVRLDGRLFDGVLIHDVHDGSLRDRVHDGSLVDREVLACVSPREKGEGRRAVEQ